MPKTKLYKVLGPDGQSIHGGSLQWSLPTRDGRKWKPGKWHSVDGPISICSRGLHLTTEPYEWYKLDCTCYLAEGRGDSYTEGNKTAFREARLIRPTPHPKWWRDTCSFITTIRTTPYFKPDGKPKTEWKVFSSWAAARDAAGAAAGDAAWDAAGAAAEAAAWDAAGAAAGDAAWDAAWAAARDAAWAAALLARCLMVSDKIDEKHLRHARDRWEVWQKGYGLACDLNGVLYVYEGVHNA